MNICHTQGKLLLLLQTFTTQEYLKQSLKETLNAEISCQDETVFRKEIIKIKWEDIYFIY